MTFATTCLQNGIIHTFEVNLHVRFAKFTDNQDSRLSVYILSMSLLHKITS